MSPVTARLLVAPLAVLAGTTAFAQGPRVTVGGESKPSTGTIVSLVNADTACAVELRDDDGAVRHESADFELCFQQPSLVGRRVALTWTEANVMAESCQGDPECGDSERIALIATARIIDEAAGGTSPTTFCSAEETIVFACRTRTKQVSVCASADAAPTRGYVQYRFGKPGGATPLELQLPTTPLTPPQAATADNLPFAGGGASWMRFRRGDHAYVVYSGIGKWGPNGEVEERAGIVVERRGEAIATLACNGGKSEGELGPDWFERVGMQAKGEEFDLPL
ncbi:MAG: hypothetical protein LW860_13125 [Xanthomonadaceae bacterium]|jgi:hypothetical protein|nr:hypothetical protein [Xanthomonadaceae bacterium]